MFPAASSASSRQTIGSGVPSTPAAGAASGFGANGAPPTWMQSNSPAQPSGMPFGTPSMHGGGSTPAGMHTNSVFSTPQHSVPQQFPGFSPSQSTASPFAVQQPLGPSGGGVPSPAAHGAHGAQWGSGIVGGSVGMQASPMNQAPVSYLPGYLNKIRGGDRPNATSHRASDAVTAPAVKTEADTSSILHTKERASSTVAPSSSPNGFHSSFFSRSSMDGGESSRSPPPANAGREGSIFGYSSLRGSRPPPVQDDFDRSMTHPSTSPPLPASLSSAVFPPASADAMDDDDAPPQQALQDMSQAHLRVFDTSVVSSSSVSEATQPTDAAISAHSPQATPLVQRSVLVFGFPALMRPAVVEQFAALGSLESVDDLSAPDAQDKTLRLVFREPAQALQAVLQNGKSVGGVCMIGARWENDAMHQQSLVHGIDAPLLSSSSIDTKSVPSTQIQPKVPSTPASKMQASGKVPCTPAFGKPIFTVDTPNSALAQPLNDTTKKPAFLSMMNLRASLFGAPASQQTMQDSALDLQVKDTPKSVWGYVAEGLFGW